MGATRYWIILLVVGAMIGTSTADDCDGKADDDGSDEKYIHCHNKTCSPDEYRCSYGACVPKGSECNGQMDCHDNSDEVSCSPVVRNNTGNCSVAEEFICHSGDQCIRLNEVCNGKEECEDSSDESLIECNKHKCNRSENFRCAYGGCVHGGAFCDQYMDCHDGSDEDYTPEECADHLPEHCKDGYNATNIPSFYCKSEEKCIEVFKQCDGNRDCADGSDEVDHKCERFRICKNSESLNDLILQPICKNSTPGDSFDGDLGYKTGCVFKKQCKQGNYVFREFDYWYCYNGQWFRHNKDECEAFSAEDKEYDYWETVKLTCPLDQTGGNYVWLKKEDEVYPNNSVPEKYSVENEGKVLVLKDAVPEDSAKYSCIQNGWIAAFDVIVKEKQSVGAGLIGGITVVAIIVVIFVVLAVLYLIWIKREKKMRDEILGLQNQGKGLDRTRPLDEQADALAYNKTWEFPKALLTLGSQLGSGAFGVVLKGEALGIVRGEEKTTVAVKMVRSDATPEIVKALATELKILIHIGQHINIVNLLGACTKNIVRNELHLILEYCPRGNLHDYLVTLRSKFRSEQQTTQPEYANTVAQAEGDNTFSYNMQGDQQQTSADERVNPKTMLCWCFQIARGMEYLASRRVIHGDLATRNILLANEDLVKISDFGLARSLYSNPEYHKKSDAPVPLKWLAIESVQDCIFSTQSDVWSFGITLWEIFSLAMTPYSGVGTFKDILTKLLEGYRMEKPQYADDNTYKIMMDCWKAEPSSRPTFAALVCTLGNLLESNVRQYYIQLNQEYEVHAKETEVQEDEYLVPVTVQTPAVRYVNVHTRQSTVF